MKAQKIMNLLNDSSNEESKFATKQLYVIDSQGTKDKCNQVLNQIFVIILMHLF